MSKTWNICEQGTPMENEVGTKFMVWYLKDTTFDKPDSSHPEYVVWAKVSQTRQFVALNFARFMRANPDWPTICLDGRMCPIDFRYVTEDIGGTNHPAW